jgi:hypothetical protein
MAMFSASGLKIERAEMRISELDTFVTSFASATGLYSVQIEKADAIMAGDPDLIFSHFQKKLRVPPVPRFWGPVRRDTQRTACKNILVGIVALAFPSFRKKRGRMGRPAHAEMESSVGTIQNDAVLLHRPDGTPGIFLGGNIPHVETWG